METFEEQVKRAPFYESKQKLKKPDPVKHDKELECEKVMMEILNDQLLHNLVRECYRVAVSQYQSAPVETQKRQFEYYLSSTFNRHQRLSIKSRNDLIWAYDDLFRHFEQKELESAQS